MAYIDAPFDFSGNCSPVFFASGIDDAENWHTELIRMLGGVEAAIVISQRTNYLQTDIDDDWRQIE